MTRTAKPATSWDRGLPTADLLVLVRKADELVATDDALTISWTPFTVWLHGETGETVDANSVDELVADLRDVHDSEIKGFSFTCGETSPTTVRLEGDVPNEGPASGRLSLRVTGSDSTRCLGVFGQLKAEIDRTFAAHDRSAAAIEAAAKTGANRGTTINISGDVKADRGSSIAISGVGDSTAGSHDYELPSPAPKTEEPAATPASVWQNIWVVTIVGGMIAAVIAALIIYWILN